MLVLILASSLVQVAFAHWYLSVIVFVVLCCFIASANPLPPFDLPNPLPAATSQRTPEGRKLGSYEKHKPSVPLAVTVPQYSAVEFLSLASYYTQGHVSAQLHLRDLLSE